MVSAGGLGTFLAISCYFHTNNVAKVKATAANLQMLAALGQLIGTSSVPAVIGADWNTEPEVLKSTGFLDTFQLKLAHEPSSLGSCISSGGRNVSNIDYFALSKTLSDVLEGNVYFCKLTPPRPHRPTHVDFSPRPKAIQVQVLKELKALPVDPPFGPQPPPSEWGREAAGISVKLSGYLAGVQVGDHFPVISDAGKTQAKKDLDEAMTIWFEKVENDVQYIMGAPEAKEGRGEELKTIRINLINTFKSRTGGHTLVSKAMRWTQMRFQEFAHALRNWAGQTHYPGAISSLRRVKDLIRATISNGIVLSPFKSLGLSFSKLWLPKLKSIADQTNQLVLTMGFRQPILSVAQGIATRCEMFATQVLVSALELEQKECSESRKSWKLWVEKAGERQASLAHKFTKAPLQITTVDLQGQEKNRSQLVLDEVDAWSSLWKEQQSIPEPPFPTVPRLPSISTKSLRKAAFSFKRATCALAGIHPRHIGFLSDPALLALAQILEASEAIGTLPSQLLQVIMALLPKATGGLRPIGWCQSVARVWAKSRAGLVKTWQTTFASNRCFAAGKGKSAIDVVWRHSCKAELANHTEDQFGLILWDLHKCYELINHASLVQAGHKHSYPMAILRVTLALYRAPRRILLSGVISREIMPSCGIIAGVSSATAELRLILLDVTMSHIERHPKVDLNIFIDDLALDSTAQDTYTLVEALTEAAQDLAFNLEQCLDMPIARSKSSVLSNSVRSANLLRRCLKDLGGPPLGSVRSLGIDFWAAAPKIRRPMRVRRKRNENMKTRKPKLQQLKSASSIVAGKVFVCGVLPSVLFDSPIYGLFGRPLKKLRSATASILGISGPRRDLNLVLAFVPDKDPEMISSKSVIKRFAIEVWNAARPAEVRDQSGVSLGSIATGLSAYLSNNRRPPTKIDGPISALHNTLHNAGWSFKNPFILKMRSGQDVHLLNVCPKRVVALFSDDLEEVIQQRAIVRLHMRRNTIETRALYDNGALFKPLINRYRSLPPPKADILLAFVSDGVFTNSQLLDFGYDIDPVCKQCNLAADTVFHQCYSCIRIEGRARLALGQPLFDDVIAGGSAGLLGTRALFAHPGVQSSPDATPTIIYYNYDTTNSFSVEDGEIFGDGSCLHPNIKCLSRAGFGIVQVSRDGILLRSIYGSVPAAYPQTSLAAEYAALSAAFEVGQSAVYTGDCAEVLRGFAGGPVLSAGPDNPHACFWKRAAALYPDWSNRLVSVIKTKAHRSLNQVENDSHEIYRFHGNQEADKAAKAGALLHAPPADEVKLYKGTRQNLLNLVDHAVDVLYETRLQRMENRVNAARLPAGTMQLKTKATGSHNFCWMGNIWMCTFCLRRSSCPNMDSVIYSKCKGTTPLDEIIRHPRGHALKAALIHGGGTLIFCSKCFYYASPYPRKLMEPCGGKTTVINPSAEFYLRKNRHPVTRERLLRVVSVRAI